MVREGQRLAHGHPPRPHDGSPHKRSSRRAGRNHSHGLRDWHRESTLAYTAGAFDDLDIVVQGALLNSTANIFPPQARRRLLYSNDDPIPASPISLPAWSTFFGTVALGQRAFAFVYAQTPDGLRSAPTVLQTDVV